MSLVLISSPTGGAGKSSIALELASLLADNGRRTLLLEAGSNHLTHRLGLQYTVESEAIGDPAVSSTIGDNLNFLSYGPSGVNDAVDHVLATPLLEPHVDAEFIIADLPVCEHREFIELQETAPHAAFLYIVPPDPVAVSLIDLDGLDNDALDNDALDGVQGDGSGQNLFYVLNLIDPRRPLCRDIEALVRFKLRDAFLGSIHYDAAVPEAAAKATTASKYSAHSQFAVDIGSLSHALQAARPGLVQSPETAEIEADPVAADVA